MNKTTDYLEKKFGPHRGNPHILKNFVREDMYKMFADLGFKTGLETGIEKGKNAQTMYEIIPNLHLYGVDSYKQHPHASYAYHAAIRNWNPKSLNMWKQQCLKRMEGRNFTLLQNFTEDAVRDLKDNSLDFIYLDADHSYDFVMQDIILLGRKVKKGGIISGHDYFNDNDTSKRRAKIIQAIDDYTNVHGIKFYVTGENHNEYKWKNNGDYYPSWFFVKLEDVWPNVIGA